MQAMIGVTPSPYRAEKWLGAVDGNLMATVLNDEEESWGYERRVRSNKAPNVRASNSDQTV